MRHLDVLRNLKPIDWNIEKMAKAVEKAFKEQDEEDWQPATPSWEEMQRPYTI